MIITTHIPVSFLVPAAKSLLMVSTAYGCIRALRGGGKLDSVFFGLVIGMVGLQYYDTWINGLFKLSSFLETDIKRLGNPEAMNELVWNSIKRAAGEPGRNGERYAANIPAVIEQIFRTGVWGIATSIGDFFYLLADAFLEVRRDVILTIVRFLFPLAWGVYPALPALGNSVIAYLIEMSLWGPCLYLIQVSLGYIAPQYLNRANSLGIPLVAMEIVATLLILSIPSTVHRLVGGALHPDGENALLGLVFVGGKAAKAAMKTVTQTSEESRSVA